MNVLDNFRGKFQECDVNAYNNLLTYSKFRFLPM